MCALICLSLCKWKRETTQRTLACHGNGIQDFGGDDTEKQTRTHASAARNSSQRALGARFVVVDAPLVFLSPLSPFRLGRRRLSLNIQSAMREAGGGDLAGRAAAAERRRGSTERTASNWRDAGQQRHLLATPLAAPVDWSPRP